MLSKTLSKSNLEYKCGNFSPLVDFSQTSFVKVSTFKINKNKDLTFKQAYKRSFKELEKLFINKFEKIRFYNYQTKKNLIEKGSFQKIKDLPKGLKDFNVSIHSFIKKKS